MSDLEELKRFIYRHPIGLMNALCVTGLLLGLIIRADRVGLAIGGASGFVVWLVLMRWTRDVGRDKPGGSKEEMAQRLQRE